MGDLIKEEPELKHSAPLRRTAGRPGLEKSLESKDNLIHFPLCSKGVCT